MKFIIGTLIFVVFAYIIDALIKKPRSKGLTIFFAVTIPILSLFLYAFIAIDFNNSGYYLPINPIFSNVLAGVWGLPLPVL